MFFGFVEKKQSENKRDSRNSEGDLSQNIEEKNIIHRSLKFPRFLLLLANTLYQTENLQSTRSTLPAILGVMKTEANHPAERLPQMFESAFNHGTENVNVIIKVSIGFL